MLISKTPPLRDRPYLDFLRTQSCILTGFRATEYEAVDPCHIGTAGKGLKSPDSEALPIRHSLHVAMHNGGELTVLRREIPDWLLRAALRAYARSLYAEWCAERAA